MLFVIWRMDSIKVLWKELRKKKPRKGAVTETVLLAAHWSLVFALIPWHIIPAYILLSGLITAIITTATHQSEEMFEDFNPDFVDNQFRSTRDATVRNPFGNSGAMELVVENWQLYQQVAQAEPQRGAPPMRGRNHHATTPVPLRPQQAGLVSREEEEEEDEVPEGQEISWSPEGLAGKPRRRGGRNRKRGSRKDFEKSDAQPPQPAGKGKAKGQVQKEAAVSAGPSPCDSPPNAKPSPTTMVRAAMPMQMPLMHMAYPRLQPMYGGLPVFFPKAGQGKGPEPLIIGGPPGTLVDGNWFSMPMMWPQACASSVALARLLQDSAKEIRALFEWVDPGKGETRHLLREKHGEESTRVALIEGGEWQALEFDEDTQMWLQQPTVVGLSDFACLYGHASQEEEAQDEGFSAQARLMREVTEAFLDSKIKVEGFAEFNANCPAVSEEELSKVPGAKVALGSVDALKLEVLVRDGASVIIKPDEAKYFRSIPDRYCEEFEKLFKEHGEKYAQWPESQFEEQSEETPRPTVQAKATGAKGAKGAKGRGRKGKSKGQAKDGQSKDANMKEQAEKKNDGDPAPEAFTDPNAFPEAKPEEAQIEEEEEEEQESEEVVEDVEAVDEDSPAKLPVLKRPAIAKHFMKRPALKRPASQTDAGPVKPSEQSKATTETETKKVDGVDSVKPSKRSKATSETEKARQQLEAADEKLQERQKTKEEAEAALAKFTADMEEERRLRAEEALKDKRSELIQARREETAAQQRLEKANKNLTTLQDAHWGAVWGRLKGRWEWMTHGFTGSADKLLQQQHGLTVASEAAEAAQKAASEAATNASGATENFGQALTEASKQLDLVDARGCAAGDGAADAAPDRLKKALKALDKLKNAMDNNSFREKEFETTEENLVKIEPGRERDRHRLEQLVTKAQQRAETSREAVLQAVQNFVEAGMWFAESLQKTQKRPVKMEQVKAVQSSVKSAFRQLPKVWQTVKGSKEARTRLADPHRAAQGKAGLQHRKALGRLAAATLAKAEAESQVEVQVKEHNEAETEEEHVSAERSSRESELAKAEASKQEVEAEEAEAKKRREELKASQPNLKEALKAAKLQEREADAERKALHARASKREKERCGDVGISLVMIEFKQTYSFHLFPTPLEQELLEEAKKTAVKHLKNEEYDARQVEQAYSEKRNAKKGE
eukprot:g1977.t1